jgi:hypothetical protein
MKISEEVGKMVQEKMEAIGARVADISIYPSTIKRETCDVLIVAGYFPGRACLLTIDADVYEDKNRSSGIKFHITGECEKKHWKNLFKHGGLFLDISRNAVGSESCGGEDFFDINHYVYSNDSAKDKMDIGMNFFENFLNGYAVMLKPQFTKSVDVWYVPEYSDDFAAMEKKYGEYNSSNYAPFNSKVLAKFPKGIFAEDQRT